MTEYYEWRPWVRSANSGFSRQKLNANPSKRGDFQALKSDYLNNLEIANVDFKAALRLIAMGSEDPMSIAKKALEQAEKRQL